jgi:aldehyde:ferredoxin oxidoreductase
MIIVEGKAKKPVYLWIKDGEAEIRDASNVWGKTTHETEDLLLVETDLDAKVATIGPAGENGVLFSCIINDKHRTAGRSGVGAVMGSKNLKAVVVRGTGDVEVSAPKAFLKTTMKSRVTMKENPVTGEGLPALGTAILVNIINSTGILPTRNFSEGVFEGAEKISGESLAENLLIRNRACFGCPIACGRMTQVKNTKYAGSGEGPEYETDWALGAACGIDDLEAITKANYTCNELGLDTISAGATIACAMELYEAGHISKEEAGCQLNFGNTDAMVEMVERIALRQGFGDILAQGSKRVAKKYRQPGAFMGVKGQEFPAYDPRGVQGMAINYATSNRGACHVRGYMISPEILGIPEKLKPGETKDKATWCKAFQDLTATWDSSGLCLFATFAIGAPEITALLKAATGIKYTQESVMEAGERIWNMERQFNLQAGLSGKDDTLPKRLLETPIPSGPSEGSVAKLSDILPEYYKLRGWNKEGVPQKNKLKSLGLA